MNLYQIAEEISRRLSNIFLKDKKAGVFSGTEKFSRIRLA